MKYLITLKIQKNIITSNFYGPNVGTIIERNLRKKIEQNTNRHT